MGCWGQDAEGEGLAIVGNQRQAGVADEGAERGGGREGGNLFGKGIGVEDEVAHAEGEQTVELLVGGDALVERFVFLEDVLLVAGRDGGGVAIDEADARKHDGVFAEAGPMGVAGPEGQGEGVGGVARIGGVVAGDGGIGGVFAREAAEAGRGLRQGLQEGPQGESGDQGRCEARRKAGGGGSGECRRKARPAGGPAAAGSRQ